MLEWTESFLFIRHCEVNVETKFKTSDGARKEGSQRAENKTTLPSQSARSERGPGDSGG